MVVAVAVVAAEEVAAEKVEVGMEALDSLWGNGEGGSNYLMHHPGGQEEETGGDRKKLDGLWFRRLSRCMRPDTQAIEYNLKSYHTKRYLENPRSWNVSFLFHLHWYLYIHSLFPSSKTKFYRS